MEIYKFKECNVTYAANQPEYIPLPAHKDVEGCVTSCWSLSFIERIKVLFTGKIFLQCLTFNQPLQPLIMSVSNPVRRK